MNPVAVELRLYHTDEATGPTLVSMSRVRDLERVNQIELSLRVGNETYRLVAELYTPS